MNSIPYIYVSEESAKELGCTHESVLYGVPGYSNDDEEDSFNFIPKFYPLTLYLQAIDWLTQQATMFIPEDKYIVVPFRTVREL